MKHNRRTCPRINQNEQNEQDNIHNEQVDIPNEPNMEFEEKINKMILTEQYVRNMLITGKINELTDIKMGCTETLFFIQKMNLE